MRWMSHDIYYFYHYFCLSLLWSLYCLFITLHKAMNVTWHIYYFYHYLCLSLLWSLYCLFITLHKAMNVPWHILLLPLFLHVFTLVIILSFYNPSHSDECPLTYITSTIISACHWSLYCLFITLHKAMNVPCHILLLPLFLYIFTLVIILSFYNPSQSDDCPMTYITSTTISVYLYFGHYIVFL
jgi:hypothetical protein